MAPPRFGGYGLTGYLGGYGLTGYLKASSKVATLAAWQGAMLCAEDKNGEKIGREIGLGNPRKQGINSRKLAATQESASFLKNISPRISGVAES